MVNMPGRCVQKICGIHLGKLTYPMPHGPFVIVSVDGFPSEKTLRFTWRTADWGLAVDCRGCLVTFIARNIEAGALKSYQEARECR